MNGFLRRLTPSFLALCVLFAPGCIKDFEVPEAQTADGKVFVRRCSLCHALPNPTRMEYPKWQLVVEQMARNIKARNVPQLTAEEKGQILAYLKRNAKPILPGGSSQPADSAAGVSVPSPTPPPQAPHAADPADPAAKVMPSDGDAFLAAGLSRSEKILQAPKFALSNLSGKQVSLKNQRGKLVLLNFWATWCAPCIKEMPTLERLADTLGPRLSVLAVSLDKLPADDVALFVTGYHWKLPVLLDPSGGIGELYAVRVMPSTYLIGPDGVILARAFGVREWDAAPTVKLLASLLPNA